MGDGTSRNCFSVSLPYNQSFNQKFNLKSFTKIRFRKVGVPGGDIVHP